ncbi:MAG: DUF3892 domain-containing protein [Verrucomicrobia bacterium]|nr:DUF3892 domain-containing protein [Verrucomicrobiota bacterium]
MDALQITSIARPAGSADHQHITHIGDNGRGWRFTAQAAISMIESQMTDFFIEDFLTRRRTYLGVVHEPGKPAYLRAHVRGRWNDDLLTLPACVRSCRVIA